MKRRTLWLACTVILMAGCGQETASSSEAAVQPRPVTLEHQVATLDAGTWIPEGDTSVARIRSLLADVRRIYAVEPARAADMSQEARNQAKREGLATTNADLLDFTLAACESTCTEHAFVDALSTYIVVRSTTGQSHQQAVRGFILVSNIAKRVH